MTDRKLPKWELTLEQDDVYEQEGYLEYLRFGAIQFVKLDGGIIRILAHGTWKEVVRSPNES